MYWYIHYNTNTNTNSINTLEGKRIYLTVSRYLFAYVHIIAFCGVCLVDFLILCINILLVYIMFVCKLSINTI